MNLARIIASFGGTGFSPKAPGTVGSGAALMIGYGILHYFSVLILGLGIVVVCPLGLWAANRAGGGEDHGWIVIDEVAGMWIALLGLFPGFMNDSYYPTYLWAFVAFGFFRLFDITKPGLVGWFDKRHDAVGIMGDDIVAGVIAALVVMCLRFVCQAIFPM